MTLVSVVVTTKNEEKNIAACLKSIFNQQLSDATLQVLVIDNHSTDKTRDIAESLGAEIYVCGPERNSQRNFGLLDKANGEILLWIDADMILHPFLIQEGMAALIADDDVVAATIPEIVLGTTVFSKIRRFERGFYDATPIDGARFIKQEVMLEVGGFSTEWEHGPDDWDLDMKLKKHGRIKHVSSKIVDKSFEESLKLNYGLQLAEYPVGIYHNESRLTLMSHLRKKFHYSSDFDQYIKKWKGHPDLSKQLGLKYRFFVVFFEKGKWKMVLRAPLLYLGFLLIKSLTGFVFVVNSRLKIGNIR